MRTLLSVLARNGFVAPRCLPHAAFALAAAIGRWPFSAVEKVRVGGMMKTAPRMEPPIFIVGHWRSGTTHLYNLLTRSPRFGYVKPFAAGMPWDMLGLAVLLRPLLERMLPGHRPIDSVAVHAQAPQEDEIALANMVPLSFKHGIYFPKRLRENVERGVFFDGCTCREVEAWQAAFLYFLRKVWLAEGRKRLVVKNPVYTARVALLADLFPGAKFVHIHRNPYIVFESTREFYARMFETYGLQEFRDVDIDGLVLDTYPRMMRTLIEDSARLRPGQFAEIGYDSLVADPLACLRRVYDRLGLGGYREDRPRFDAYLQNISGYQRNAHQFSAARSNRVRAAWGPFIERWGYGLPYEAK